jgi:hypothetical protein
VTSADDQARTSEAEPPADTPDVTRTLGDEPDAGFTLADAPAEPDPTARARELGHRIARELAAIGPRGWRRLAAVFALTTVAELAQVTFTDEQQRVLRVQASPSVLALARDHREVSAAASEGPWWRLLVRLTSEGQLEIDYDYGDEPFPDEQLFAREAYLADLRTYPRDRLPVWLAAYLGRGDQQSRPPTQAARQARADRAGGVRPVVSERDFPALPTMWARWAVLAGAFVAAGSPWGPRVLPSLGWFEGDRRGGSTLYVLPGGRAVLSGGVWNAPALDAAYNGGGSLPELYAGAPEWVANPVLNPRVTSGLLSFCYWWQGGRWHRGDSPAADRLSEALPGIRTSGTVGQVIAGLMDTEPADTVRDAVATLVSAAEAGVVTRDTLVAVFGDDGAFDLDSALYQLILAGVAATDPEPMPEHDRERRGVLDDC